MKKQRKLSLKKVNIAHINYAQLLKGGGGHTNNSFNCASEPTDPLITCVASGDMAETCKVCKTDNTRGNGSI